MPPGLAQLDQPNRAVAALSLALSRRRSRGPGAQ